MSKFKLIEYSSVWFNKWNKFVDESNNGTIFHRIDFLEYHGERFKPNENHLIWLKGDEIFCVLPLAIFYLDNKAIAKSPFGASYGGIISKKALNYNESNEITTSLIQYLKDKNIAEIIITIPTKNLEIVQSDTLFYCLLANGFKIINSDITSVVILDEKFNENRMYTSRNKELSRKAEKASRMNVSVKFNQSIDDFWSVLDLTFSNLKKNPTHSYEEWKYLCEKFPMLFWNDVAYIDRKPIAGIGHIRINSTTDSSFYICSDQNYNETQALSMLIFNILLNSKDKGFKYFDFGTSSIKMVPSENIFRFKESFGAIGVFRHTLQYIL